MLLLFRLLIRQHLSNYAYTAPLFEIEWWPVGRHRSGISPGMGSTNSAMCRHAREGWDVRCAASEWA
eukprot:2175050-Pyramimonas_sp.AAC.1